MKAFRSFAPTSRRLFLLGAALTVGLIALIGLFAVWFGPRIRHQLAYRTWLEARPDHYRIEVSYQVLQEPPAPGTDPRSLDERYLIEIRHNEIIQVVDLRSGRHVAYSPAARMLPFDRQFEWVRGKQQRTWIGIRLRIQQAVSRTTAAARDRIAQLGGDPISSNPAARVRTFQDPRCFDFTVMEAEYDPEFGYPLRLRYRLNQLVNSYAGTSVVIATCRAPVEIEWRVLRFEVLQDPAQTE